jgi:hypothetical protein
MGYISQLVPCTCEIRNQIECRCALSLSPFVVHVKAKRSIAYGSVEETINCNKVMVIKPIPYPNQHNVKEGNRRTSKA